MTGIVLRDYQAALIADASAALRSHSRVLMALPTGGGKTACACHMTSTAVARGLKVAFIVHRIELVKQSIAAFAKQGIECGVIAAGFAYNPYHDVYVCNVGTLARRMHKLPCKFDMIIIDEAHHSPAGSWAAVIKALSPRWSIGLSATPCRLDGRGLGEQFDAMVTGPSTATLIKAGHLSDFKVYAPSSIDMTGARTTAGDYNSHDAEEAADKPAITGDAVDHYQRLAPGKRAVVFCVTVAHAKHVADAFNAAGIPAAAIDGSMAKDARAGVITDLERGDIMVMTSCAVVSEGFDLPAIEVAISLRPTGSLSLWLQQIGRVLRPAPGKTHAIIIDHAGNTERHGFADDPREWSLDAKKRKPATIKTRTCPDCYAIHQPAPVCPECGHVYQAQQQRAGPEERDGILAEIDREAARAAKEAAKREWVQEIRAITTRAGLEDFARKRGYKRGWVDHYIKSQVKWGRKYA